VPDLDYIIYFLSGSLNYKCPQDLVSIDLHDHMYISLAARTSQSALRSQRVAMLSNDGSKFSYHVNGINVKCIGRRYYLIWKADV